MRLTAGLILTLLAAACLPAGAQAAAADGAVAAPPAVVRSATLTATDFDWEQPFGVRFEYRGLSATYSVRLDTTDGRTLFRDSGPLPPATDWTAATAYVVPPYGTPFDSQVYLEVTSETGTGTAGKLTARFRSGSKPPPPRSYGQPGPYPTVNLPRAYAGATRPAVRGVLPVTGSPAAVGSVGVHWWKFHADSEHTAILAAGTGASPAAATVDTRLLADGPHDLLVFYYGSDYKTYGQGVRTVVVDNTVPVVSLNEPAAGAPLHGTVRLRATVQDLNPVTWQVAVAREGRVLATLAGQGPDIDAAWEAAVLPTGAAPLPDGEYTLLIAAADAAGNTGAAAVRFELDSRFGRRAAVPPSVPRLARTGPPVAGAAAPPVLLAPGGPLAGTVAVQAAWAAPAAEWRLTARPLYAPAAQARTLVSGKGGAPQAAWDTTAWPDGPVVLGVSVTGGGFSQTAEVPAVVANRPPGLRRASIVTGPDGLSALELTLDTGMPLLAHTGLTLRGLVAQPLPVTVFPAPGPVTAAVPLNLDRSLFLGGAQVSIRLTAGGVPLTDYRLTVPADFRPAAVLAPLPAEAPAVTLAWFYVGAVDTVKSVAVQRSTDGTAYTAVATPDPDKQQFTDPKPPAGQVWYRLAVQTATGLTSYSAPAALRVAGAMPPLLSGPAHARTRAEFQLAPGQGLAPARLHLVRTGPDGRSVRPVGPLARTLADEPGRDGTYTYRLVAYDGTGRPFPGPEHAVVFDTQPPPPPEPATVTASGSGAVLAWPEAADEHSGIAGYRVTRADAPAEPAVDLPPGGGPYWFDLPPGAHTLAIAAVDRSGNVGEPAMYALDLAPDAVALRIGGKWTPAPGAAPALQDGALRWSAAGVAQALGLKLTWDPRRGEGVLSDPRTLRRHTYKAQELGLDALKAAMAELKLRLEWDSALQVLSLTR